MGKGLVERFFYEILITEDQMNCINLNEGSSFQFFDVKNLPKKIEMVPFDLAAVLLFSYSKFLSIQITPS